MLYFSFPRWFSYQFLVGLGVDLIISFCGAVAGGYIVGVVFGPELALLDHMVLFEAGLFSFFLLTAFFYLDLYDVEIFASARPLFVRWCRSMTFWFFALVVMKAVFGPHFVFEFRICVASIFAGSLVLIWRYFFRKVVEIKPLLERTLVLGSGKQAKTVAEQIVSRRAPGFDLVGFIGKKELVGTSIVNPKVVGSYGDLKDIISRERIDTIVVAEEDRRKILPMEELMRFRLSGGRVFDHTGFLESTVGRIPLSSVRPVWFVFSEGFSRSDFYAVAKRIVEILISSILLALTLPLTVLVSIIIKLTSPGGVFFVQERIGKDGKGFRLYKFRSMKANTDGDAEEKWTTKGDPRITWIGKIMRPLRIDELPQIWNILKGDMSLIGPRPETPKYVELLSKKIPFYDKRHLLKPGLTGWAQVNYPYGSSLEDARVKLEYDLYYVRHMSIFFDLFIILSTIRTVLFHRTG